MEDTVAGKDLMAARLGMAWPVRQLLGVKGGQGGFSERGPLATRQPSSELSVLSQIDNAVKGTTGNFTHCQQG